MSPTYRVRFSMTPSGFPRAPTDVQSIDLRAGLEDIPGLLPAAAYIMYIDDLTIGRAVHWTRWPKSYRPGFGK